ncbi:hypothetical protein [Paraburkholderia sartisoli]|uniref:hypothetical protein n=1 Tax=Paraburkholderia sartisoli TaxID=83784 RepID=UPI0015A18FDC|nr:hypothetical protein [Paraburkholderia sartisoli]
MHGSGLNQKVNGYGTPHRKVSGAAVNSMPAGELREASRRRSWRKDVVKPM